MTVTKEADTIPGYCQCGRPLHYRSSEVHTAVQQLADLAKDQFVTITIKKNPLDPEEDGISYRVQRHYIALHGFNARVAKEYGFEEVPNVGS